MPYCTMCTGNYSEMSTAHRYQTCPYYNGCKKCGQPKADVYHVRHCKGTDDLKAKCPLCSMAYTEDYFEHRKKCFYHTGCPTCGKKFFAASGHVKECQETYMATSEDDILYACRTCKGWIKDADLISHQARCVSIKAGYEKTVGVNPGQPLFPCSSCGKDIPGFEYTKHKITCQDSPVRQGPEEVQKIYCWICDEKMPIPWMDRHQEWCLERLKTRFSFAKKDVPEIRIEEEAYVSMP